MTNNKRSLVNILIHLSSEEDEIEKSLSVGPDSEIVVPSGFEIDIAWELANLTRIAYKDYELFNGDSLTLSEEMDWGLKISQKEKPNEEDKTKKSKTKKKPKPSEQDRRTWNMQREAFLYADSRISSQRIDEYFIEHNVETA